MQPNPWGAERGWGEGNAGEGACATQSNRSICGCFALPSFMRGLLGPGGAMPQPWGAG